MLKKKKCKLCGIHKNTQCQVTGRGSLPADVLFIGDIPSKTDTIFGMPFMGKAGKFFDYMLNESGLEKKYYITNMLRCLPEGDKPLKDHVKNCEKYLLTIKRRVKPKIVVFIGAIVERTYRKHFTKYYTILHPSVLIKQGGILSPNYRMNLKKLKIVKEELTNEKKVS